MGVLSINIRKKMLVSMNQLIQIAGAIGLTVILASCGNSPGYSYTVSGTVSGLAGAGLVLQNNSGDDLTITSNGTFNFPVALSGGGAYNVTIKTQPGGLFQTCTVVNGSGSVNNSPVVVVRVNCTQPPARFAVDSTGTFASAVKYNSTSRTSSNTSYTIDAATGVLTAKTSEAVGTNPPSVTMAEVDAGKMKAYVANFYTNSIFVYTVEADGALTEKTEVPAGTNPVSVTVFEVAPSVRYAYVPNWGADTVSVYAIDGATGALVDRGTAATGPNPYAITIKKIVSSGVYVAYVLNTGSGTISVYTIDVTTGALTAQGLPVASGFNPGPVVVDPSGKFAYAVNTGANKVSAYTIDPDTGKLTAGVAVGTGSNPISVVLDPSGKHAYVQNFRSNSISIYTIGAEGGLTAGTAVTTGTNPYCFAIDPTGKFAYAANYNSKNISVYTIGAGGALTKGIPATVAAGTNPYSITISQIPSGGYAAYVLNAGSGDIYVYAIDAVTGALTRQQP